MFESDLVYILIMSVIGVSGGILSGAPGRRRRGLSWRIVSQLIVLGVIVVSSPWGSFSWKVILTTIEAVTCFPGIQCLSGACVLGWYPVEVLILEGDVDHQGTSSFHPRKPEYILGLCLGLGPRGGHFPESCLDQH